MNDHGRRYVCVVTAVTITCAGLIAPTGAAAVAGIPARAEVVTDWNATMIDAMEAAGVSGPVSIRFGAIVATSVYDAVNGVTRRFAPYRVAAPAPPRTSAKAAAAGAAYEALVRIFPTQQPLFDQQLADTLAQLPGHSPRVTRGLQWGSSVADEILTWRAGDGIAATLPPYVATPGPGRWQPTQPAPPGVDPTQPLLRQFAIMTPWAMTAPEQFLPAPPPALTSQRYARDFAEVKSLGSATSTERTAFQTDTALFWASDSPNTLWNRVTDSLRAVHRMSLTAAARLFARENIAMADASIAIWNAKNYYDTWRPITAIQQAGTDGNPATAPDAAWQPLVPTPLFQEYPSGHAGASQAAAAVLARYFGNRTSFTMTSPHLPDVTRSFRSFSEAAAQVGSARVLDGIHFRFSCDVARSMGRAVARNVFATQMQRIHGQTG